jgi:hypothetical protein
MGMAAVGVECAACTEMETADHQRVLGIGAEDVGCCCSSGCSMCTHAGPFALDEAAPLRRYQDTSGGWAACGSG